MFIKLNKNTLYVNFKKRIHSYTHYTHMGVPLHLKTKTTLLITLLAKNIIGKILIKKEKYEMKGKNKNNKCEM